MLKNIIITLVLLCSYLSLMIMFKQLGLDDALNLILSSILLGLGLKMWINQHSFIFGILVLLSLLFTFMQDLISIPIMISSVLFGSVAVHFFSLQKQKNMRAQRRPKDENREFLN